MFIELTSQKLNKPLSVNLDNVNKIEIPEHTNKTTRIVFADGTYQFVGERYADVMSKVNYEKSAERGY